MSNFSYPPHFVKLSEFDKVVQPSLILRHILGCASSPTFLRHILGCASSPTFLRHILGYASSPTFLRLLCAPHFVKLSEFDKVVQPSSHTRLRQLADFPSSHTRLCQLADFPSSHTRLRQLADFPSLILRLSFAYPSLILRSTFAQPSLNLRSTFAQPSLNLRSTFAQGSLKVRPRWRKLAACAQFKIHNSKFIILPHSPLTIPLPSPYHPLTIRLKISKKN